MTNPTHDEVRERLLADDPELREVYEASEPAYLVAREVIRTRTELGISQAELARRVGTSQSVISRLENMDGSPNLKTVLALATALGRRMELHFVDPAAEREVRVDAGLDILQAAALRVLEDLQRRQPERSAQIKALVAEALAAPARYGGGPVPESVDPEGHLDYDDAPRPIPSSAAKQGVA